MRKFILAAAAVATVAAATAPTIASAQYVSRCERASHSNKVTGTVVGGVLGALAGNAISRGGGGAVVGGLAGAALGNNVSRIHCRDGYAQRVYDRRYYDTRYNRYRDGYNENRCSWQEDRGPYGVRQVQVCR